MSFIAVNVIHAHLVPLKFLTRIALNLYRTIKNCPVKKTSFGRAKFELSITYFCAPPPYCIAILVVLEI